MSDSQFEGMIKVEHEVIERAILRYIPLLKATERLLGDLKMQEAGKTWILKKPITHLDMYLTSRPHRWGTFGYYAKEKSLISKKQYRAFWWYSYYEDEVIEPLISFVEINSSDIYLSPKQVKFVNEYNKEGD